MNTSNQSLTPDIPRLNAFSIDVEGFIESNLQSFHIPGKYCDSLKENTEIERNTEATLELLGEVDTKATFFFVGRIAREIPAIVKKVAAAGHEIGCHNFRHLRVFGIEKKEFEEKLRSAKKSLEDVSGKQVYGFRAPDFSITRASIWALDILKETGFLYDTSIYPFGLHDVYGIEDVSPSIHRLPNGLIEFPMSTFECLGKRLPFGGGGYFRLYPLFLTKYLLSKANRKGLPGMFYIHPYEVGPVIPRISEISAVRKFRHYYHCKNGGLRVKRLLKAFRFCPVVEVLRKMKFLEIQPTSRQAPADIRTDEAG